eukprot:6450945-Amphidinium_carterae.1
MFTTESVYARLRVLWVPLPMDFQAVIPKESIGHPSRELCGDNFRRLQESKPSRLSRELGVAVHDVDLGWTRSCLMKLARSKECAYGISQSAKKLGGYADLLEAAADKLRQNPRVRCKTTTTATRIRASRRGKASRQEPPCHVAKNCKTLEVCTRHQTTFDIGRCGFAWVGRRLCLAVSCDSSLCGPWSQTWWEC